MHQWVYMEWIQRIYLHGMALYSIGIWGVVPNHDNILRICRIDERIHRLNNLGTKVQLRYLNSIMAPTTNRRSDECICNYSRLNTALVAEEIISNRNL